MLSVVAWELPNHYSLQAASLPTIKECLLGGCPSKVPALHPCLRNMLGLLVIEHSSVAHVGGLSRGIFGGAYS